MSASKPPYTDLKKRAPEHAPEVPPDSPPVSRHEVQPGEHGDLLSHYNELAAKMGIDNPPRLIVSGYISEAGGCDHAAHDIVVADKILRDLTPKERLALMAYELGRELQQRGGEGFLNIENCEADAVLQALKVTGSMDALICMLTKVTQMRHEKHHETTHSAEPVQQKAAKPAPHHRADPAKTPASTPEDL